jgi:hypothetical protein
MDGLRSLSRTVDEGDDRRGIELSAPSPRPGEGPRRTLQKMNTSASPPVETGFGAGGGNGGGDSGGRPFSTPRSTSWLGSASGRLGASTDPSDQHDALHTYSQIAVGKNATPAGYSSGKHQGHDSDSDDYDHV